jgi:hypothetical protein
LAAYVIELDENGCLKSSRLLKDVNERDSTSQLWLAYVETDGNSPWYNDQTYVDTLSEKAMAHFIEITHEVYKEKVGSKFGTAIPCIFTDEPQFTRKNQLSNPRGDNDVVFPWTSDLAETFEKAYGSDLLEHLPEIVWNLPDGKPSLARFQYHDHTCERFVSAFMDQLGGWCRKNNLMLNGHMMEEPTLGQQTCAIGEAMRCYRNMDMPGMDLLVDWVEYNTAKQVSSVARQNGLRGAMSELYGVTHWHFTFEGHKGCGDWQAALGITMRVHHLTWFTMRGEGKRDYPASIGYQSPWYKEYGYIENHFARVGVAMTRGKALTRVAVIHPIESYWLSFGPNESGDELGFRERAFSDLTNWLLSGLIDFDFISESLLPGQVSTKRAGKLTVGHCDYDAVIVPNLRTIRSTTLKALRSFSKSGGRVIIAGSGPDLVDAQVPSSSPTIENSKNIFWSSQSILHALEDHRDLRILGMDKAPLDKFLYQMRQDGDERFVFICNRNRDAIYSSTIILKGIWKVEKLDTFTGEQSVLDTCMKDSWTMFNYEFEGTASLLIRLTPTTAPKCDLIRSVRTSTQVGPISISKVELEGVKLSEPNVLMLDYAEYKFNDEDWSPRTEVLKIDNILRRRLDLPLKGSQFKQPWAVPESDRTPKGRATLRFTVNTEFTFTESALLALEDVDKIQIHVNDIAISPRCQQTGEASWWVDEDIKTVEIPHYLIHQGKNTVTLSFDFGILTNIERIYLLGDFSVLLEGNAATLQPLDLKNISWGDITKQGLPFYVGNVIYKCSYEVPSPPKSSKSDVTLHVPQYSSPVLSVSDVKTEAGLGRIAFQPRKLELGESKEGKHEIEVTAYGNRFNSFGHIHAISWVSDGYCGPDIWRCKLFHSLRYIVLRFR